MVKLRAGKKKATTEETGIVSADFKKVHKLPSIKQFDFSKLRTKRGMAITVLIVLIVAVAVSGIIWTTQKADEPPITKIPSEQEYADNKLKNLERNTPDVNASKAETLQYYDDLESTYGLKKDYTNAAETFTKRADIESSDLDYLDYSRLARYYMQLGDKQKAVGAIDKAISVLPPAPNEKIGYDPVVTRDTLQKAKEELQK